MQIRFISSMRDARLAYLIIPPWGLQGTVLSDILPDNYPLRADGIFRYSEETDINCLVLRHFCFKPASVLHLFTANFRG